MSFRDNLQHLRMTRNMTQEQLAMLLGVSRQAVSKWEAERAYPEMDKLIRMAAIFECTLDELVSGDLTERPKKLELAIPENAPATDVCGYDDHMRQRAWTTATGIGVVILGVAGAFAVGTLFARVVLSFASLCFLCLGAVLGLALLVPAQRSHASFVRRHPFVQDFYTDADRDRARELWRLGVVLAVVSALLGLTAFFVQSGPFQHATGGLGSLTAGIAVGVWALVLCGMLAHRVDVDGYNRRHVERADEDEHGEQDKKAEKVHRHTRVKCVVVCVAAMVVSVAGTISMLITYHMPLYPLPLIVGVLCTAAVWMLMRTFATR